MSDYNIDELKAQLEELTDKLELTNNEAEKAEFNEKILDIRRKLYNLKQPLGEGEKEIVVNKDAPNRADHKNNKDRVLMTGFNMGGGSTTVGI